MGATSDLRNHLGDANVQVRFGGNRKYVTMSDGSTIEVDANATHEEVAQALNATPLPTVEIIPPPAPAAVPVKIVDDAPLSNITGLQSGAFQTALVRMRQRLAGKQNQAISKIVGAVAGAEAKMDAAANDVTDKVEREIAAALQEFAQHTNGGPQ